MDVKGRGEGERRRSSVRLVWVEGESVWEFCLRRVST